MTYVTNPATLRLAAWVSVLGALAAVGLRMLAPDAGAAVGPATVVAVMVVGCVISTVRTSRLPRETAPAHVTRAPMTVRVHQHF